MGEERRKHQRFAIKWQARVMLADRSLYAVPVNDVSLGGVSIRFPHVVPINTQVNIEFHAQYRGETCAIRAKTVVAHHTLLEDNSAKLGLKFTQISREHHHLFNNILQELVDKMG
ncbi:PilZ domain-containing protein [Agaribacterium haliotis]|uniref:PilZ domain-containing protein n=1 Tax=Agaribacterium haliotis TaxID=2013869 RepID=UPI000BB58DFE|nr:PilZ domain-containing protein [Agaribacterium haliotis]